MWRHRPFPLSDRWHDPLWTFMRNFVKFEHETKQQERFLWISDLRRFHKLIVPQMSHIFKINNFLHNLKESDSTCLHISNHGQTNYLGRKRDKIRWFHQKKANWWWNMNFWFKTLRLKNWLAQGPLPHPHQSQIEVSD